MQKNLQRLIIKTREVIINYLSKENENCNHRFLGNISKPLVQDLVQKGYAVILFAISH